MKKNTWILFFTLCLGVLAQSCQDDDGAPEDTTAPENVSNLTGTAYDAYVVLKWEDPSDSDFQEISLTYTPGGTPSTLSSGLDSLVIENLTNGVEYTFTLKSRDENGNLASGASIVLTPVSSGNSTDKVYVGDVLLSSQAEIDAFEEGYTAINGNLTITGVDVDDLSKFELLDSITGSLEIYFADTLTSIAPLGNLRYIGNTLYLRDINDMPSLEGLDNLEFVANDLVLLDLDLIENLDAFSNLINADEIFIGIEAWKEEPKDRGNKQLSDFCGLKNLFQNGEHGDVFIENNLLNPTKDEIVDHCN